MNIINSNPQRVLSIAYPYIPIVYIQEWEWTIYIYHILFTISIHIHATIPYVYLFVSCLHCECETPMMTQRDLFIYAKHGFWKPKPIPPAHPSFIQSIHYLASSVLTLSYRQTTDPTNKTHRLRANKSQTIQTHNEGIPGDNWCSLSTQMTTKCN